VLENQEDYSNDALYELLCGFAKENGYKNGQILWPIRTALSGKQMTPAGATEILEVLGKEESLLRLQAAVEKLRQASGGKKPQTIKMHSAQEEAVRHFKGPMMLLAGPGSEKTASMTRRVENLLETYHVNPGNILVVTFTKAAAREMKTRFEK